MSKKRPHIRSRLIEQLKNSSCPPCATALKQEAQRAQQETLSYEQYLLELVERECQARRQHRVERFLRESRLPLDKSLDTFEMKLMPRNVAQQVRTLLDGSFLDRRENILAFGNPGSGKTHLVCALGQELVRAGRRIYFTPAALLVQELLRAKHELKLAKLLKRLALYDGLILDDIGYVQQDRNEMRCSSPSCRALRTRHRDDHQQPALLQMGTNLQRPHDHRSRHRPACPSQHHRRVEHPKLPHASGQTKGETTGMKTPVKYCPIYVAAPMGPTKQNTETKGH